MSEQESNEIIFVTDDTPVRERGKIDETDRKILESVKTGEGLITIKSEEQLMALAKGLSDTFNYYQEQARKCLTREQAEFIRKLRVDGGYSWRAVARACHNQNWKGWERWEPPSSQPMGMALCERAAEFFSENYTEAPWN